MDKELTDDEVIKIICKWPHHKLERWKTFIMSNSEHGSINLDGKTLYKYYLRFLALEEIERKRLYAL